MESPRRVTLICPNYAPETNAAARRITALAERLATTGWQVEVATQAPHHPQNRIFEGYGRRWRETATERDVRVVRFRPWIVSRGNFALRLLSELVFSLQAMVHVVVTRADLVVASSPYMFVGPFGLLGARLRGMSFAWDVRDLTWQYLRATGRRTFGTEALFERIMRFTARRTDVLTTATFGQLEYFGLPTDRAAVMTNGLSHDLLESLRCPPRDRRPGDRPTVVYAGLLGFPQGLAVLLDVADRMKHADFVLVGDGPERSSLEAAASARGLTNVTFPGFVDGTRLRAWYEAADVLVAHLRSSPAFEMAQPSKLWEYMATGRPVVFGGQGEAVDLMEQHQLGLTVPPDSVEAMAAAIDRLLTDPTLAACLANNGRTFVATQRNREALLSDWEDLLIKSLSR